MDPLPLKKSKEDRKRPISLDFSAIGLSLLFGFSLSPAARACVTPAKPCISEKQAGWGNVNYMPGRNGETGSEP